MKRRGEVKQKTVEPLHLAMINHGLYLFHYDPELEGTKDETGEAVDPIRKFALTRIGGLEPTGRRCKAREFDVHERIERGMGAFDGKDAVDVELRFSPRVAGLILERPWHKHQVALRVGRGFRRSSASSAGTALRPSFCSFARTPIGLRGSKGYGRGQ